MSPADVEQIAEAIKWGMWGAAFLGLCTRGLIDLAGNLCYEYRAMRRWRRAKRRREAKARRAQDCTYMATTREDALRDFLDRR